MNIVNIILYVLIILIKYVFFCILERFNFLFYQSMEFIAFNQNNIGFFAQDSVISDIWMWSFYGNAPMEHNTTTSLFLLDSVNYSNHTLVYYLIAFLSASILIPIFHLTKSLIKFKFKNNWKFSITKVLTQICFLGFLPITTLCINELTAIETNNFELSMITISLFSLVTVTFPALIFNFIFGSEKRKWRRKLYYLIDPFKINFKYYSIILMLRQLLLSIVINIFNYNKIVSNSLMIAINFIYLFFYFYYKPFEQPYIQVQAVVNLSLEIVILGLNYLILYSTDSLIPVLLSILLSVFIFVFNIIVIHKDKTLRTIKLNKPLQDNSIELEEIIASPKNTIKCTIPEWANKEYLKKRNIDSDYMEVII
ncbi:hypothetical protein CPAV1605_1068 [seawater metagenome]|uniref:Uncharacterized protein n=1 Tax=seawater metagenome TaxID=1561972 RepID=A0A5E8CJU5_9ZZZZ